ncbi:MULTISPECIES: hypothetical protein [Bacteria]|jgi:hypothetical protein|uniref:hypothetical protein n=1 Tax=Bacteria TaxID=2 RepID=UPI00272CB997|nr:MULTISPECIES: hypothetical protein [Bacteria]
MPQKQPQELDRQISKAAGVVAPTPLLYHMAQSYLGFYQDHAQQFAESFDELSPQPWTDLDPHERNSYLVQAAVEHAAADKDLLDDKFISRMADSAADMARKHESAIAERAGQAHEKPTRAAASPAADAKRATASASALVANLADRNRARAEGIEH